VSIYDFRLPIADWKKSHALAVFGKIPVKNHKSEIGNRKFSRGLTLIEVLLSVAILGIGAGVLMLATARCLAVISQSRHYSNAQRLIHQVSAEHPLTRGTLEAGSDSGSFDDAPGYTWEREITEPESEDRKGLNTVRTRVSWSDRGRESFEEVVTWHYILPEEEL
jgi:prepilin-type N-terminal cleavage/methylation domain-containing protein